MRSAIGAIFSAPILGAGAMLTKRSVLRRIRCNQNFEILVKK